MHIDRSQSIGGGTEISNRANTNSHLEQTGASAAADALKSIAIVPDRMLKTDWLKLHRENQLLRAALDRILRFPVCSEPVGSAYAMQDIAQDALS